MKLADLYTSEKNRVVKCLACSWYCRISPDQIGVCATRVNRNGKLYSLVYGRIIGPELDPIEKKPLHHFLPGQTVLSIGTLGCNFGCLFCQNDWMSQTMKYTNLPRRQAGLQINKSANRINDIKKTITQLSTPFTPQAIVEATIKSGAAGIAYTYNEPAIFVEFVHDTAKLAKKHKLKNIFVSNGFESKETFDYTKEYIDAINIDLKSFRSDFYRNSCKADIEPVKENIKRYFNAGIETEVTTLVIPDLNDSESELTDIATFLVNISPDIPWHVSAFSPAYKMMDTPPTPTGTVINAWKIGKKAGLHYVYAGNISDTQHTSTICPTCNAVLIERVGYNTTIKDIDLSTGNCIHCHTKIYGVWS
jgi:pyruvate formate lyase activating enzyme